MAYDKEIAEHIRNYIGIDPDVSEKTMFGGLAFLINGHMAVTVSSRGGLMIRVDPVVSYKMLETPGVKLMEMKGRKMAGWLFIKFESLTRSGGIDKWIALGVDYARTLAPK